MITNNPLFQVLVMSQNNAIATAGKRLDELIPGQLGIFDYETNLTITTTTVKTTRRFYLAVGVSTTGATTAPSDDSQKSAASYIQLSGIQNVVFKAYAAPVNQVVTFTIPADSLLPETDYGVELAIQNQEAFANFGYNLPSKSFIVKSGIETDPTTGTADTEDYIDALVANINADDEGLVVAAKTSSTTFTVTISAMKVHQMMSGVNLKYNNPRGTIVVPVLKNLSERGATAATTTAMVYAQGAGYDIVQREYEAGGWNGNPGIIRASDTTYLDGGVQLANPNGTYGLLAITYTNDGIGGGQEYQKSLLTEIAVPSGSAASMLSVQTLSIALGGNTLGLS